MPMWIGTLELINLKQKSLASSTFVIKYTIILLCSPHFISSNWIKQIEVASSLYGEHQVQFSQSQITYCQALELTMVRNFKRSIGKIGIKYGFVAKKILNFKCIFFIMYISMNFWRSCVLHVFMCIHLNIEQWVIISIT